MQEKNKQIIKNLQSDNTDIVMEAIKQVKESSNRSLLPNLVELLNSTKNQNIYDTVLAVFTDLKDTESIPILVEAIRNCTDAKSLKQLVAACWMNGMDYSQEVDVFSEILSSSNYETAIEAFTVLTSCEAKIGVEVYEESLKLLMKNIDEKDSHKQALIQEGVKELKRLAEI